MLNSILEGVSDSTLTLQTAFVCSAASLVFGVIIAVVYMLCTKKYSKSYVTTLVILPILVQTVIMLVNGNVGTGVAVMGAFSLVRFRSLPGSSKEIGVIFFAMADGLATGMGYIGFAAIITVLVSLALAITSVLHFGEQNANTKLLRVTVPEDLDYSGMLNDIFDKYTEGSELVKVKTTNLGSLYDLSYNIILKKEVSEKAMIDEIRCRNGNLMVTLCKPETRLEEL